jgi:hypothetical protein
VVHLSMEPGYLNFPGLKVLGKRHPSNLAVAGPTIAVCPTVLAQRPNYKPCGRSLSRCVAVTGAMAAGQSVCFQGGACVS